MQQAGNPAVIAQATQIKSAIKEQADKLFSAFLFVEPPSVSSLTRHGDLMALDLNLQISNESIPDSQLPAVTRLQNELFKARIALTHQRIELHRLIWSNIALLDLFSPSSLAKLPELFIRELRLFFWHIQQTLLETKINLTGDNNNLPSAAWLMLIISVLTGTLFIAALIYLTKKSEKIVYLAQEWVAENLRNYRWALRLANSLSRFAALLPWVLLLFSLSWIADLLLYYQRYTWLWLLPFLQIVAIYALLSQILEWLTFKIATSSGAFLNTEQSKQMQAQVKKISLLIVIPWGIALIFHKIIGASLLLYLFRFITAAVIFIGLSLLLKDRRQSFIKNTEQALARELSATTVSRLNGPWFYVLAPIILPIQLGYFAVLALSSMLQDLDWYRRLSARWFWLRTRYQLEQQKSTEVQDIAAEYRYWFSDQVAENAVPVIDTGLSRVVKKDIEAWLNDRVNENTLVLTGEKGMGKTTVLSQIEKELVSVQPDLRVLKKTITHKITRAEELRSLIGALLKLDLSQNIEALAEADAKMPPTVVVLDECQNLFLAQIGGLDAWKALIDLTNLRLENIFWVFVINDQSWAYLGNVFGRQYQMRDVIRARRWSHNDIRSLILSRTHLSGFRVHYDEVLLNSYGAQQNTGRSAEQRFFSLLWDSCKGVPWIALTLWLTAIKTQGKEVWVGLPSLPDASDLSALGDDLLFVYRAILIHENISVEELIAVTKQSESLIRYALKTAVDIGFLECSERRYRITALWHHSVITYLARKNMSHE